MVASRRIFIVSSSHPYHNCKIPFLYEHVMTPIMTPRRRRYLFLLSISSRASTSHIVFAPIMFALHSHSVSIKVVPCLCHHCSFTITFTCVPFDKQKFYNIKLLSAPLHSGSFRLHPVYHVLSELSFLSYLYEYLLHYPGFSYYSDTWTSFLFFIVLWVVFVAFSGNNASPFWDTVLFNVFGLL
ncbi:hypothetical protein F5888DRAFT_1327550 [Russula emetica]|nr:hypothetical protein F5888DRAFT_1327550 [Russula emetica]